MNPHPQAVVMLRTERGLPQERDRLIDAEFSLVRETSQQLQAHFLLTKIHAAPLNRQAALTYRVFNSNLRRLQHLFQALGPQGLTAMIERANDQLNFSVQLRTSR